MLTIHSWHDLTAFNTLAMPAKAQFFAELSDLNDLPELLDFIAKQDLPSLWIGGGSNLVLADEVPGCVVHIATKGIEIQSDSEESVLIKVAAGESWHGLVTHCLENGWYGLENLALIPGSVGASPVQNIGAYGVEVADLIDQVEVFDTLSNSFNVMQKADCQFAYRDSLFKRNPGRFIITSVRFSLSKQFEAKCSYAALQGWLDTQGIKELSAQAIFDAVVAVRQSKLPNPEVLPNAGSFFKNPVVSNDCFEGLRQIYPEIPNYPDASGVKLAAGWLIDQCGWKGLYRERVGVHKDQALVIVNHAGGSRQDIDELADDIKQSVFNRFSVRLEQEPIAYP
jgi:UDP-N-acetylmuramate dehydrogenase